MAVTLKQKRRIALWATASLVVGLTVLSLWAERNAQLKKPCNELHEAIVNKHPDAKGTNAREVYQRVCKGIGGKVLLGE